MPRKRRFYQPGIPVHVFQRGHNREPVFFDDQDYLAYSLFQYEMSLKEEALSNMK
jgi:putative transposase